MYTNLENKHIEDDVGRSHRNCFYFRNGICEFNEKNCKGSSNCGSLFSLRNGNKSNRNKVKINKESFNYDTTKQVYHLRITEADEVVEEKIYIRNRFIVELQMKGYVCVNENTPVALHLKDCSIGYKFSISVDGNTTYYEVLDIENYSSHKFEDFWKKKVRDPSRNNIIRNKNSEKEVELSKKYNNTSIIHTSSINNDDVQNYNEIVFNKKQKDNYKNSQKPEPAKYGISKNDLLKYQKYKHNKEKIDAENLELKQKKENADGTRSIIGIISFFITLFVIGLIFAISIENSESEPSILLCLFLFIGLPILVSYLAKYIYTANNTIFNQNYQTIDVEDYLNDITILNINKFINDLKEYDNYDRITNVEYWNSLNGYEFEENVADLFRKIGYSSVRRTQGSYDGGVDITMEKDGKRYAVQCKHHAKPVGADPLRSLHGILDKYDEGIFVSLNGYSERAFYENYSWSKCLKLYDLNGLIRLYKEYFDNLFQEPIETLSKTDEWVYDDVFKYGILDLEQFAKDVIEGVEVVGKTKNELIKMILRTLTIEELNEMCDRYNIKQTKDDIVNLIIKNKDKIK